MAGKYTMRSKEEKLAIALCQGEGNMLTFPCNPNIPSKNQQTQNTDYPYLRFL